MNEHIALSATLQTLCDLHDLFNTTLQSIEQCKNREEIDEIVSIAYATINDPIVTSLLADFRKTQQQ